MKHIGVLAILTMLLCTTATSCQAAPRVSVNQSSLPAGVHSGRGYYQRQEATLPEGTTIVRDVNYVGGIDSFQTLDLFVPPEAKSYKVPVVVWIHGGGWTMGGKKGILCLRLVPRGFAVVNMEYRLSQKATWPAQIYDCKAAIRWVRAHANQYHLDSNHIGVWGASAGGQLALLLGTTNGVKALEGDEGNTHYLSDVQAVCDWFGPTDFTHLAEQIPKADPHHQSPIDALDLVSKLLGGPLQTHREEAKQASPISYLNKNCARTLIIHGDSDNIVPVEQSREFYDAAKAIGADVTLHVVPHAGHGNPGFTPEIYEETLVFFDRLKSQSGSPYDKHHSAKHTDHAD